MASTDSLPDYLSDLDRDCERCCDAIRRECDHVSVSGDKCNDGPMILYVALEATLELDTTASREVARWLRTLAELVEKGGGV